MKYKFTIWSTTDGVDHAQWSDIGVSTRKGATMALARRIIALDGVEDGPVEVVDRTGRARLTSPSIFSMSGWSVLESETAGPKLIRYSAAPPGLRHRFVALA